MGIKGRIEKLEQFNPGGDSKPPWLVVVTGGMNREAAGAKVAVAIAEYGAKHPDQTDREINLISVIDEETKDLIPRVAERTGKLLMEVRDVS